MPGTVNLCYAVKYVGLLSDHVLVDYLYIKSCMYTYQVSFVGRFYRAYRSCVFDKCGFCGNFVSLAAFVVSETRTGDNAERSKGVGGELEADQRPAEEENGNPSK